MGNLATSKCGVCNQLTPKLSGDEIVDLLNQLAVGWGVPDHHHLLKRYAFRNFGDAQRFVTDIGNLAEEQGHHPDIKFGWRYAEISIFTHAIDGLSRNDFILAAKIDAL